MSPTMLIVCLSGALAVLVGRDVAKWLFTKDTEVENRRRAAFHLAGTLKGFGLKDIPEFLGDYAVGDYSGMFDKIHQLATLVLKGGEDAVVKEFSQVYSNVLDAKLATSEGRALIAAKLDEAVKAAAAAAAAPDAAASLKAPVQA